MRLLIFTFIGAFCLCAVLGFFAGMKSTEEEPSLIHIAYRNIEVEMKESPPEVKLVYFCDKEPMYSWDIDKKEFQPISVKLVSVRPKGFRGILKSAFWDDFFGVAGGASIWKLEDLVKAIKTDSLSNLKQAVSGTFGVIAGFSFGYELGTLYGPTCSDPKVLDQLVVQENWRKFETALYERDAKFTLRMISEDGAGNSTNADVERLEKKGTPTSQDMIFMEKKKNEALNAIFKKIDNHLDELRKSTQLLNSDNSEYAEIIKYICILSLPLIIAFVMLLYLFFRPSEKKSVLS